MLFLRKAIAIIIGSVFLAVGINLFLFPNELLDGGMIGIGLIINYLWGFKAGLAIIICSIPIFILAWYKYREYFFNSIHGLLVSSFLIDVFSPLRMINVNTYGISPLFSSVLGGLFVGLGIGLMLRFETSTGGTDLLAQFMADTFSINVGVAIFIIDAVVVSFGGMLIAPDTFILSLITILMVGITTSMLTLKVIHY